MKTILLFSILLSLLLCASPAKSGLDRLGLRLLLDIRELKNEESQLEEEEELQIGEEENTLLNMHLIGEDGENTMFHQSLFGFDGQSMTNVGTGFVSISSADGSFVSIPTGGSSSSGTTDSTTSADSSGPVNDADTGDSSSSGTTDSTASTDSPVFFSRFDDFTDPATFANYWTFELGSSRIEGGFLYIDALEEPFKGSEYISASISSQGKVTLQYGLFTFRAKFSYTKGVYPLFMLFNEDRSCSVVVMGGGISPNIIFSQVFVQSSSSTPAIYTLPSGTTEDFHDYGVLWYPSGMDFDVDGELYASVNSTNFGGQWPFDTFGMFMNLQLVVINPDESSVFPQEFVIDNVFVISA